MFKNALFFITTALLLSACGNTWEGVKTDTSRAMHYSADKAKKIEKAVTE